MTRAEAAANALGSVRAEGLDPGRAEPILAAWARGELTDEQLEQLGRRLLHERELTAAELLPASTPRKRAAQDAYLRPGTDCLRNQLGIPGR